jgi:hypothetical protein
LHVLPRIRPMDPYDPQDAQLIVVEYIRTLERDLNENRHPARVDSLPHAKPIIKDAIRTSARHLVTLGQMTDDMRGYLETAYTLLAEYLEPELVKLMNQYRQSAEELEHHAGGGAARMQTAAWRTLVESSTLAGEVARATANEAESLREEFRDALIAG